MGHSRTLVAFLLVVTITFAVTENWLIQKTWVQQMVFLEILVEILSALHGRIVTLLWSPSVQPDHFPSYGEDFQAFPIHVKTGH